MEAHGWVLDGSDRQVCTVCAHDSRAVQMAFIYYLTVVFL